MFVLILLLFNQVIYPSAELFEVLVKFTCFRVDIFPILCVCCLSFVFSFACIGDFESDMQLLFLLLL